MTNLEKPSGHSPETGTDDFLSSSVHRRSFLKYAGAGAASVALIAAGCKKDKMKSHDAYLGTGDIGILNYAYTLEQLEAAFYIQAVATPYSGITSTEATYLTDIRDHEIAHREFFKNAIPAEFVIQQLEVDFSTINFSSRDSVLATAMAFEDLGVTAYNGAGYLLQSPDYLLLAGKIVSVEARHAALIRELISINTFLGDQVDANSVNISRTPAQVLSIAGKYIKTKINTEGLPS